MTGNEIGMPVEQFMAFPASERAKKLLTARANLYGAGAHYVTSEIWNLIPIVGDINKRLALGERP